MSVRAEQLIEQVADGASARETVNTQINEGLDIYSITYKIDDLQNSVSHNTANARSLLMKCKAFKQTAKAKQAPDLETDLNKAHKALEAAESAILSVQTSIEKYRDAQRDRAEKSLG